MINAWWLPAFTGWGLFWGGFGIWALYRPAVRRYRAAIASYKALLAMRTAAVQEDLVQAIQSMEIAVHLGDRPLTDLMMLRLLGSAGHLRGHLNDYGCKLLEGEEDGSKTEPGERTSGSGTERGDFQSEQGD